MENNLPVHLKLVFFMSRATPLAVWHKRGMWERETALYRILAHRLSKLSIVTAGGEDEEDLKPADNVTILSNLKQQSANRFSLGALWQHRHILREADLYKTNQMDGAWTAVLAGLIFRKPVIVRAGYLWAKYELDDNGNTARYKIYRALSAFAFRRCTKIFLTTPLMKDQVIKSYGIPAEKIIVMPNYVDTSLFRPLAHVKKTRGRIVFVGRLSTVKNLDILIQGMALAKREMHAVFVGSGSLEAELKEMAEELGVSVDFIGSQPNEKLPEIINSGEAFALISRFEGHPKALIEAMACKVPVIGSRVNGIKEIISDGVNGRLCDPKPADIARVLDELMEDKPTRERLAQEAFAFATSEYSLVNLVEKEIVEYQKLLAELN